MSQLRFGTSVLTLTVGLVIGTSMNQMSIAEEVVPESITHLAVTDEVIATSVTTEKSETPPQPGTFTYSAGDLLAKKPLDLNIFCKNYPLNSQCTNQPVTTPATKPEEVKPKPTEENSAVPAKTHGWAITPEISTLGIGAAVTKSITPNINVKVGVNGLGASRDARLSEVDYNAKVNLFNVSTLAEYYPWKNGGFHLTGGLVFQNNSLDGSAKNGQTVTIGTRSYNIGDELGSVTLKAKGSFVNSVAPYLGIGWGNAVKPDKHWGFSANLGVMFAGSPKLDLIASSSQDINTIPEPFRSGIEARIQTLQNDLEEERKKQENALNWLNVYPVLSVGVSYQF